MKQGVKPTYAQRKILEAYKLDTYDHLVSKVLSDGLVLQRKSDNTYIFVGTGDNKVVIYDYDVKSK